MRYLFRLLGYRCCGGLIACSCNVRTCTCTCDGCWCGGGD